jgi:hypothetical protein
MIRAILSLAAAAILAGCMTTESSPTAARSMAAPEPPTFTISVVTGIKSAPVDSPLVKLTWNGPDSVNLNLIMRVPGVFPPSAFTTEGKELNFLHAAASGSINSKVSCHGADSILLQGSAETLGVGNTNTSAWVYCK